MLKKMMSVILVTLVLSACGASGLTSQETIKKLDTLQNGQTTTVVASASSQVAQSPTASTTTAPMTTTSEMVTVDVFKEILAQPTRYFSEPAHAFKYAIKQTDTLYLLLSGQLTGDSGISVVKVFAYDKTTKSVKVIDETFRVGVAGAGGFRGTLMEYSDKPNTLVHTVMSSGSGNYMVSEITFEQTDVDSEEILSGKLPLPSAITSRSIEVMWMPLP